MKGAQRFKEKKEENKKAKSMIKGMFENFKIRERIEERKWKEYKKKKEKKE